MRLFTTRFAAMLVVAFALAEVRTAAAQVCVGRPVAQGAPGRIGARYTSYPESNSESSKEYGVEAGLTSTSGTFGSAAFALTKIADVGNAKSIEGWLGQAVTPEGSPVQICPVGGIRYTALPSVSLANISVDSHLLTYSIGATLGISLGSDPSLQFVPFGGAYFQRQQASSSGGGFSSSESANNGLYEIGVVVVVNRQFSIGPVMRNVFGVPDSGRAAYGVIVSYSLGGR
jgi:hypothetical protein